MKEKQVTSVARIMETHVVFVRNTIRICLYIIACIMKTRLRIGISIKIGFDR